MNSTHPKAESETVMVRGTTQIDDETEDDETDDGDDLDGCKPKLAFTKGSGTQEVDNDHDDTD